MLSMEAPLVSLEEEFEDIKPCFLEENNDNDQRLCRASPLHIEDPTLSELENFSSDIFSFKSMEDLVNEFDEKLNVCFRNYNAKTDSLAPVKNHLQIQEEEEHLQDEQVWDALTDNYIPSMAVEWKDLHMEVLNGNVVDLHTEIQASEEAELNKKNENMSGCTEEPLLTADQVIEQIEAMMQNPPDYEEEDVEEEEVRDSSSQSDIIILQDMKELTMGINNNYSDEALKHMQVNKLLEELETIKHSIQEYSEELVRQLARRDELEFEKEVKNTFITVLLDVQNKQKEQRELMKKKRKEKGLSLQSNRTEKNNRMPMKFLNTVIPYDKKGMPPSVEDLQMLTKILCAMKEDSEKVPALLTDYILKVLCPT
ncbi:fasciculation and elongation protein zeta-1 isoform X3 [Protopterus annectens]|uniref:fasciculation and elongation protein zeta-1 isoform X3 n=1 Tax=Protopterus annectens TaxID=7888 RepID=UPI001CF9F5D0|nr:fasciculation and elongation protein zeta-1 isoform X3 [Protopterus annectens]